MVAGNSLFAVFLKGHHRRVPQFIIGDPHSELLTTADSRFHVALSGVGQSQVVQIGECWALLVTLKRFVKVPMFTERITLTMAREMRDRLEGERKNRMLETIPETVRMILSKYLPNQPVNKEQDQ